MPRLAEYFEKNRYKPKYKIGDRVKGMYHNIPFVGTVYNDSVVSEEQGPNVIIHLDLPLKYNNYYLNIIQVKHDNIKEYK